ncbi:hypothetical protein [Archangium sp.]|uniref:hypothetical protein n=1 Tax=Archangium sp. TaxID=1872627 RepID=UPI002D4FFED9|nr:hypothetical protein [Archangium sp.]HYO51923.1 hypothetical protein [Archangium sp.]
MSLEDLGQWRWSRSSTPTPGWISSAAPPDARSSCSGSTPGRGTRGCWTRMVTWSETPGLLMGLAGIGYGLLRLAAPERVPSVLTLAMP